MAKKITDEKLSVSIIINGNQAQKELYELEKSTRKLNESQAELRREKKRLEQQGKTESARYKEVTASIKTNTQTINANKLKMQELQKQIGLTGLSMAQLQAKSNQLRNTLRHLIPGSADYKRYEAELKQVTLRLNELRGKANQAKLSISGIADGFNRYQALAFSAIASMTGLALSISKILDINAKLSDAQADVRKTTGLTKVEVDELTKSFGLMKTRTARIELLKLAEEAGRLGIEGADNIKAFVNVANQMKVALGDELSEEQIRTVGKLTNLYRVGEQTGRDFEGAMLSLGSAINEVSASGANQASYLVDFLARTGGISAQVKLAASDNIGYAATFDELQQSVEVSGTMMNKVWMDMAVNTATYAKIAGMNTKEFAQLFETDANKAMVAFLKGLNGNSNGLRVMAEKLKDVEAGGTRGIAVLSALANNTHILEKRQSTSNQALAEATSLTDEFTIKNENLAATLQKVTKTITGWFSSENIANWLGETLLWFAKLIGATEDLDGKGKKWRDTLLGIAKILVVVIASMFSYKTATSLIAITQKGVTASTTLFNIALRIQTLRLALTKTALVIYTGVMNFFGIATTRATASLVRLNTVTALSPWGALLAVLSAVAASFLLFKKSADDAGKSIKYLHSEISLAREIQSQFAKDFGEATSKLKAKIEPLIYVLNTQNTSLHTRKAAYEELIRIHPDFIGTVDAEYRATNRLQDVYDKLVSKMGEKMRFESQQKVLQKYYDQEAEQLENLIRLENDLLNAKAEQEKFKAGRTDGRINASLQAEIVSLSKKVKEAQDELNIAGQNVNTMLNFRNKQIEELTKQQLVYTEGSKEWLEIQEKINRLAGIDGATAGSEPVNETDFTYNPTIDDKEAEKRQKEFEKRLEDLKKQKSELQTLEDDAENERLSRLQDGYEKERAILQNAHDNRLRDLEAQLVSEADIQAAQTKSENTNLSTKERSFWIEQKEVWEQKNEVINDRIAHEEYMLGINLATIQEKYYTNAIKELETQYARQKNLRETEYFNEIASLESLAQAKELLKGQLSERELAQITTLEQAKEALKTIYQEEELKAQEEFILQQIEQMERVIAGLDNTLGIDFNLLDEAQKDKILQDLELIKKAYAELLALKNGTVTEETSDFGSAAMAVFGDTDVLGFTIAQWESTFKNLDNLTAKFQAAKMIVEGLQNLWGKYNAYLTASENASLRDYEEGLDKRKESLKQQLDRGYINQVQYRNGLVKLDEDVEKKRKELAHKQAEREKDMAIIAAVINVAKGVTASLSLAPPYSFIAAGITAAMGALEIATIRKQSIPAKGYEQGLYPDHVKREQDGKLFKAGYGGKTRSGMVNKPTYFLAGENYKPEMVIDSATYKRLDPELRSALVRQIRGIKGFEDGYYSPETQRIEVPANSEAFQRDPELIATLNKVNDLLGNIEKNGITAIVSSKDYRSVRELRDATKKLEKVEQKSKLG